MLARTQAPVCPELYAPIPGLWRRHLGRPPSLLGCVLPVSLPALQRALGTEGAIPCLLLHFC